MHGLEALQLCFGLAPCLLCPLLGERILDCGENTSGISGLKILAAQAGAYGSSVKCCLLDLFTF